MAAGFTFRPEVLTLRTRTRARGLCLPELFRGVCAPRVPLCPAARGSESTCPALALALSLISLEV